MPRNATNAAIIVEFRDMSCLRIHILMDGYPTWTGEMLRTYYNTHQAAMSLVAGGSTLIHDSSKPLATYSSVEAAWPTRDEDFDWVYVYRYNEGWQGTQFGIRSLIALDDLIARYMAEQDRAIETTKTLTRVMAPELPPEATDLLERAKHTLAQRCRIHASKVDDEGWYVTGNVLLAAAERIDALEAALAAARVALTTVNIAIDRANAA